MFRLAVRVPSRRPCFAYIEKANKLAVIVFIPNKLAEKVRKLSKSLKGHFCRSIQHDLIQFLFKGSSIYYVITDRGGGGSPQMIDVKHLSNNWPYLG